MITSVIDTSDHHPKPANLNVTPNSPSPPTAFTYRRLNKIDCHKFNSDLNSTPLLTNHPFTLTELLDSYFTTLCWLLDINAPLKAKTYNFSRTTPSPGINFFTLNPLTHLSCSQIALLAQCRTTHLIQNYIYYSQSPPQS